MWNDRHSAILHIVHAVLETASMQDKWTLHKEHPNAVMSCPPEKQARAEDRSEDMQSKTAAA